jgi:hypothetical protein
MTVCVQCGGPLPPPGKRGPARRYCSGACRTAASRDRIEGSWDWTQPAQPAAVVEAQTREVLLEVAESIIKEVAAAPAEERLARAIVETRVLSSGYGRLAPDLPPALAWRAAEMSTTLGESVERLFGRPEDES